MHEMRGAASALGSERAHVKTGGGHGAAGEEQCRASAQTHGTNTLKRQTLKPEFCGASHVHKFTVLKQVSY